MLLRVFHHVTRTPLILTGALFVISGPSSHADAADVHASGVEKETYLSAKPGSEAPVPRNLRQWIDKLAFAESGNRKWVVHQDLDGGYNYGCLQFRARTFAHYVGKYNLAPESGEKEVLDLLYDCSFQKRLAARMIRDNPENWKHWKGTVRRIGLPPGASIASTSPK